MNIALNGTTQGTQSTLNFNSGAGIVQSCTNNAGASRIDCAPSINTALIPTHDAIHSNENYQASSNGTTAMTTTSPDKALTAYQAGQCWDVITDTSNPASLNIDGLGTVALKLQDGNTSPYTGTILANRFFKLCYNGTSFFVAHTNALPSNDLLVGDANGNPQPVTLSSFLDSGFSSTRGSILYRGAVGWAALSPGTSGYFLQTQGAGANPAWAALAGGGNVSTTGTTTAGYLPKLGSPTTGITNSQCDDGVTRANTLTCAGTGGINVPNGPISAGSVSSPPPTTWLTGGGGIFSVADGTCTVGTVPAGVSGLCDKSGFPYWASQANSLTQYLAQLGGGTIGHIPKLSSVTGGLTDGYAVQGTDTSLLTSGTISGTGAALCTDASGGATTTGCSSAGPTTNQNIRRIPLFFDGGGSALSGTITRCNNVDFAGTIQQVAIVGDQSGSATLTFKQVALGAGYTGASGFSGYTAVGSETLTSVAYLQDTTLTGFTTAWIANSVLCVQISSESTFTWLSAEIKVAAN